MHGNVRRAAAISGLACAALLSTAAPVLAEPAAPAAREDVVIVDEPDTGDLNNKWTFAPLGIPLFGLVDSIQDVPGNLF